LIKIPVKSASNHLKTDPEIDQKVDQKWSKNDDFGVVKDSKMSI